MRYFLIIMLLSYIGGNVYVFLRLWQMLPAGSWLRPMLIAVAAVTVAALLVFFAGRTSVPTGVGSVAYFIGTSWMIILLYLFMTVLVADLIPFTGLVERGMFLRSNLYTFWGIVGFVTLLMVAGNINYHNKRRVEITVEGRMAHEKLKVVMVSDLHLGYTIGRSELTRWVAAINKEDPDVVIIAGDLIDTDIRPLYNKELSEVLGQLKARYGVFMVPGNHEYISGIGPSLEFVTTTGITMLRDSTVTIGDRLVIVGRDDLTNKHRKPLSDLVAGADRSVPLVVVDHQPAHLEEAVAAGAALQLSGHTHRGQVWPLNWITDRIFEDSYGRIEKDGTTVYVSSGLGIWGGKFRIGTVSEYVVIHI